MEIAQIFQNDLVTHVRDLTDQSKNWKYVFPAEHVSWPL